MRNLVMRTHAMWVRLLVAALGGFLLPFSLAPYNLWPLSLLGLITIAWSLRFSNIKQSLGLGFISGLALYSSGVSWVNVAIVQFGNTSPALAFVLTLLFVTGLAACFALPFYLYGKYLSRHISGQTLGFAGVWVLGEWLRSWLFTGFPWLYVGYAHLETPLAAFAPIFGIFGVSLLVVLSAMWAILAVYHWHQKRQVVIFFAVAALPWLGGIALDKVDWTRLKPHAIEIGIMQPNIPQSVKWDPTYYETTLDIFSELSQPLWDLDWVIWPEAAIPYPYHHALPLLEQIDEFSRTRGTVFITGIIYDDYEEMEYYNAIIARGAGSGDYFKQRLVPFGEYVPFETQLRGLIHFFDLPTSIIHVGPFSKDGLNANGVMVAANICYEIVYPDLIADLAQDKDVILTISNDAWFGHSHGPLQHFEMARMRALETGRFVVRATNNGLSGFIDPKGKVIKTGGRFTREAITGEVYRVAGTTPFMLWKSWPVVIISLLLVICSRRLALKT